MPVVQQRDRVGRRRFFSPPRLCSPPDLGTEHAATAEIARATAATAEDSAGRLAVAEQGLAAAVEDAAVLTAEHKAAAAASVAAEQSLR